MPNHLPDEFENAARERVIALGDDINADTFAAMFTLFRVSAKLIADLETTVHRPLGLSPAGFRVLFTVWIYDSLEPREIARLSGVSRAAVSGVLNTLERDGFAERSRDQADRRLVTVRVTDAGAEVLIAAYRNQNQRERALFCDVSADDLRQATAVLRSVLASPRPPDPATTP